MEIVLATKNEAKVRALAERVDVGISVVGLPQLAALSEIPHGLENWRSPEEIAQAKATWYSRHIPLTNTTASDGGLRLPALTPKWNPIRTGRFAGPEATGRGRATALLEVARELRGPDRRLDWTEALAVARDGELLQSWIADSPPGELATDLPAEMRENDGFWVSYVWRCPEYGGRRLSELTAAERLARRDHWAILGTYLTDWCHQQNDHL